MIYQNTVLVLGAGASVPYGFPTGAQLRMRILELKPHHFEHLQMEKPNDWDTFRESFSKSERGSIDSFLGQNERFRVVGALGIASVLMNVERGWVLNNDGNREHWYRYLFNALTEHTPFEELNFSKLKIVTFNYDRSLEFYLWSALQHAYGADENAALKTLSTLEVVHVYGSLSEPLPLSEGCLPFRGEFKRDEVAIAAKGIQIMSEGRDDNPALKKAQDWLNQANAIGILGFAFDALNLRRLNATTTLSNRFASPRPGLDPRPSRRVAATCLGMTGAEARKAARLCGIEPADGEGLPPGFWNTNCLQMLRETLLLG